jgi:transcriptional antiterminator RfaH
MTMHWYLVHIRPRQEKCALENLQRQGYQCYLPTFPSDKLCQGLLTASDEPLFPRYIFIQLGQKALAQSAGSIRSTKGVNKLVSFGHEPTRVDDDLIGLLRTREVSTSAGSNRTLNSGEHVRLTKGAFADLEDIYQMADGKRRAMVLLEILSKPVAVCVASAGLREAS